MKIKIEKWSNYLCYHIHACTYKQKQFDYIYKYLDFDKLYKSEWIYFNNEETEEWFHKTYINNDLLDNIHRNSPKGYEWLKNNWSKSVFKLYYVYYSDKQELKTIVNKVINIKLIRGIYIEN